MFLKGDCGIVLIDEVEALCKDFGRSPERTNYINAVLASGTSVLISKPLTTDRDAEYERLVNELEEYHKNRYGSDVS